MRERADQQPDGAWKAGVDGAQPGIVMLAQPAVGEYYRQEFLKGKAEDVARVLDVDATVKRGSTTYRAPSSPRTSPRSSPARSSRRVMPRTSG